LTERLGVSAGDVHCCSGSAMPASAQS
jgi:hypothetical protein